MALAVASYSGNNLQQSLPCVDDSLQHGISAQNLNLRLGRSTMFREANKVTL